MTNSEKFFDELLLSLGPNEQAQVAADGDKYNFYSGLAVMARQLQQLQAQSSDIQARLQRIEQILASR